MEIFVEAVMAMASGAREQSLAVVRSMRSDEMRRWVIDHGMTSGVHRKSATGVMAPSVPKEQRHSIRAPKPYEAMVFTRDSYRCRYCGLRLIDKGVLQAFERCVGSREFLATLRSGEVLDKDLHGAVHGFKIVADHVEPHRTGGLTTPENLVSACPTCNYGKSWYSLGELGIEDPRVRGPVTDGWDGLRSLRPQLVARQH
jgi:5-methylcytosine-specific restriction endonuclease McrA